MMSERQYLPAVKESIEKAESLVTRANVREKALTAAARHWMEGRWNEATGHLGSRLSNLPT